jgi:hypothetical protein
MLVDPTSGLWTHPATLHALFASGPAGVAVEVGSYPFLPPTVERWLPLTCERRVFAVVSAGWQSG